MLAAEVVALLVRANLLFRFEFLVVLMVLRVALLGAHLVHVRLPAFLLLTRQEHLPLRGIGWLSVVDVDGVQQTGATASFFQEELAQVVLVDVVIV